VKEEKYLISEGGKKPVKKKRFSSTLAEKMEQTCFLVTHSVCKVYDSLPYESPIFKKILDLISPAKIILFGPRFKFYDP
jgi:hypothetical protein